MYTNEVINCVREHLDKWYVGNNHKETAIQLVNEYEERIRADARQKFLTWLEGYKMGDELCIYPYDRAKVIEMYEKEQK